MKQTEKPKQIGPIEFYNKIMNSTDKECFIRTEFDNTIMIYNNIISIYQVITKYGDNLYISTLTDVDVMKKTLELYLRSKKIKKIKEKTKKVKL